MWCIWFHDFCWITIHDIQAMNISIQYSGYWIYSGYEYIFNIPYPEYWIYSRCRYSIFRIWIYSRLYIQDMNIYEYIHIIQYSGYGILNIYFKMSIFRLWIYIFNIQDYIFKIFRIWIYMNIFTSFNILDMEYWIYIFISWIYSGYSGYSNVNIYIYICSHLEYIQDMKKYSHCNIYIQNMNTTPSRDNIESIYSEKSCV